MGGPILSDEPASIHSEPSRPPPELFCPECGYSLQGIESPRCPECGQAIDWTTVGESRIPWVHRKQIGRWRAYWRTVGLATFDHSALAREAGGPVDFEHAKRFRRVTALVAGVPIAAVVALGILFGVDALPINGPMISQTTQWPAILDLLIPLGVSVLLHAVYPLCVLLFLYLAGGVSSYLFHPSRLLVVRQNRAVALSHYACAPLAWLIVPLALYGALFGLVEYTNGEDRYFAAFAILGVVAFGATLFIAIDWWLLTFRLYTRATHPSAGQAWVAGALIPVLWIACALVALVVVPWVVGFVTLVSISFF